MLTNGAAGMSMMLQAIQLLFPDTRLAADVRTRR